MGPELIIGGFGLALWAASFALVRRLAPRESGSASPTADPARVSVVIPARNEAHNLPRLLDSIGGQSVPPREVLVVDDDSTDGTADIATRHGARVIRPGPLPEGWRGKPWACQQGAAAASGDLLLFLDADCWFESGGLEKLLGHHRGGAFSVAPYHEVRRPYEQLSAFFNVIMVAGTAPHSLFGQVLLIDRAAYERVGGHETVKGRVLENLGLAKFLKAAGTTVSSAPGRGMVSFRMYPDGLAPLVEGWTKGFASGAAETPRAVVVAISLWISMLMLGWIAPLFSPWLWGLYLLAAAQLSVMLRRTGSFSPATALLYPLPLAFYFALFTRSLSRSGKTVTWRGREFHAG